MNDALNISEPFVCIPEALTKEQWATARELQKVYIDPKKDLSELSDGYEFAFEANGKTIADIAQFIAYESLCCPFINFEMSVRKSELRLKMYGPAGAKDFIKAEFAI